MIKRVLGTSAVVATLISPTAARAASGHHTTTIVDRGSVNSRHKVLHPKDSLVIRFDECGTCGYHWSQVTKASGKVITTKGVAKGPDNAPGVVGGVGTHTYTFTAKAVGSTTAKLGYFAPGASKPERVVTIALTVTKQSS